MSYLALNPVQVQDSRDRIIASLQEENRDLQDQVAAARRELEAQRSESSRAVAELRRQLLPLFQALRAVFGEIDAIAPQAANGVYQQNDKKTAVWESWMKKLPGKRADFIQALLEHGEMTGAQLRVATHTAAGSVAGIIHELKKLGLINKNGGKYSLKEF
jgi:hypothetical protein